MVKKLLKSGCNCRLYKLKDCLFRYSSNTSMVRTEFGFISCLHATCKYMLIAGVLSFVSQTNFNRIVICTVFKME